MSAPGETAELAALREALAIARLAQIDGRVALEAAEYERRVYRGTNPPSRPIPAYLSADIREARDAVRSAEGRVRELEAECARLELETGTDNL